MSPTPAPSSEEGGGSISRELDRFFLRFPLAVIGIDRDLRVAFANPRAQSILGRDGVQVGLPFDDGAAAGSFVALAERLTTTEARLPMTRLELPDGRRLRVTGVAARGSDPAVLMIDDVTDEARHEEITGDFLRNASHQLRTPLTGIAAAVQVLQAGAKNDPEQRDRFLAHIERHTARLAGIARGLLVLARAQSGEAVRLELVELAPLLDELASEAQLAEQVALRVSCEPGLTALCDRDLLHEAVAALVDNAAKHTREGHVEVSAAEANGQALIHVVDTGPGILAEHRERLFEPFYRPTPSGEGFGLGLAIAAQAVATMQGELIVDGKHDGPGTSCTIRLPSARMVVR